MLTTRTVISGGVSLKCITVNNSPITSVLEILDFFVAKNVSNFGPKLNKSMT